MGYSMLGEVLNKCGAAQSALSHLEEAYTRFQRLARQGITEVARMASGERISLEIPGTY
jgi:hypothetical protein